MRPLSISFDGQSLNLFPAASPYPTQLMALLSPMTWAVPAVNSTSYADRTPDAPKVVDPFALNATRAVLIDVGCQKELATLGLTAAQALSAMTTYLDARRTAGFDVIIASTVPGSTFYDAAMDAQRLALNNLIRSSTHFDGVVDLAADPRLQNGADTTFFADGVHYSVLGASVAASIGRTTLASLGIT